MFQPRILLGSADWRDRTQWAEWLTGEQATLDFAGDEGEVRTKVRALRPDMLVLGRLEPADPATADVQPGATALEICRELKGDSRTAQIMILMIVDADEADIEQAVLAGANDLLSRPVKEQQLRSRVASMLALKDVRDRRDPL